MTLLITDQLYEHLVEHHIIPFAQKGARRKSRGCKDHLLLDAAIIREAKRRSKDVSFMWIDYQKAYDRVPHQWIKRMLSLYKIAPTIINFILVLMPSWRTKISLRHS